MAYLLDTTFLIDLEREGRLETTPKGATSDFLEQNKDKSFNISIITMGELSPGFNETSKENYLSYVSNFQILPIDIEVTWIFGQVFNELKRKGKTISNNDLWIASTAIRFQRTVVTRNLSDFEKIGSLKVAKY